MKGDFSRSTFDATRHYSGVLMQQGRVQLDADWNEQLGIQRHRDHTEAVDVIGPCGAPKHAGGFLAQPTPDGKDLLLSPGRFYVQGHLCELESTPVDALYQSATQARVSRWHVDGADFAPNQWLELSSANVASVVVRVQTADPTTRQLTFASSIAAFQPATALRVRRLTTYLTQPDLPDPPFFSQPNPALPPELNLPDGTYLLYLDVWPRHLTALDDDHIREKALGGPDTTTRAKTIWQLRLWPGPNDGAPLPDAVGCGSPGAGWDAATAPCTGRLAARTKPAPDTDNPCLLPPEAGYLSLENQLYRAEIHAGGVLGTDPITFKWSRDNGSVVKAIEKIEGSTDHTVHDIGPDDVLGLANGQWVEQVDDVVELHAIARDLFQFQQDPITGAVTLDFPVDEARHPKLRRWDSNDVVTVPPVPVGDGWIDLEQGIQVRFEPGTYRTGDYWLIPARTALGDVEWPRDGAGNPLAAPRRGIPHQYCRTGVLHAQGGVFTVADCRPQFPPLTELTSTSSCCTFTVGDGTTHVGDFTLIQEAVNHLPAEGGEICIFPGTYVENVRIEGRQNVHLKGCGSRTLIVSAPPGFNTPSTAVFHLLATEGVTIESLAIQADPDAPGILADGGTPNCRIAIERVSVTAAKNSAIAIRAGDDVAIESCRVTMTDLNGGWPGIFLRCTDGLVRENVVEGTLHSMSPAEISKLAGALVVNGLQLGGGCERVRVHGNLFRGCSGQGITLGSLTAVDRQGQPTDPGRDDPCAPCDDPSTGDRPPGEDDTLFESDGDLYDIDIRRNRIVDDGLDGIGVIHFFDLGQPQRQLGLVRVADLAIVDNRIERVVCRAFAPIPPFMLDLMAYGGISLALVEGLVIRDNRIEDVGLSGLLPVCGIFVLYGEGIEIGRNHVLNSGRAAGRIALPGRRGGIHVVFALPLSAELPLSTRADAVTNLAALPPPALRRLGVAAVVEENSVDVSQGQALALGALGPVSVVANRLISRGLAPRSFPSMADAAAGLGNALTQLAALVVIVNLGSPAEPAAGVNVNGSLAGRGAAVVAAPGPPGTVLFDDNICSLSLEGTLGQATLPPAILVMSLDDVGFQDNQCSCVIGGQVVGGQATMPVANLLFGSSVRVVSNRFQETLNRARFSAWTLGVMTMTSLNQANHCLLILGTKLQQDQPNHILIGINNPQFCPDALKAVMEQLKSAMA